MRIRVTEVLAAVVALTTAVGCRRAPVALVEAGPRDAASAEQAMVVSASPYASRVGAQIMARGGNAVDAAIGVAFTLAVTYPTAGNIGGGGLMIAHVNGQNVALDFREVAPLAATRDMYLDAQGDPTKKSVP